MKKTFIKYGIVFIVIFSSVSWNIVVNAQPLNNNQEVSQNSENKQEKTWKKVKKHHYKIWDKNPKFGNKYKSKVYGFGAKKRKLLRELEKIDKKILENQNDDNLKELKQKKLEELGQVTLQIEKEQGKIKDLERIWVKHFIENRKGE